MNARRPNPDLRARILQAAQQQPSPTRAALVRKRWLAAVVALLWILGAAAMGKARPNLAGLVVFALWGAGAVLTTSYVLSSRATSVGRPRLLLKLIGPALGLLVVLGAWFGGSMFGHSADGHTGHFACGAFTIAIAIVPLALGMWVERASDPIAPAASGAALGAVAGAWAGVAMSFLCGRSNTGHVLIGHVFAFLVVVVVAALVGRRALMLR